MKNLINLRSMAMVVTLFAISFASCLGVSEAPRKKSCRFDSGDKVVLANSGGDVYMNVVSDRSWEIINTNPSQTWCSFDKTSGPAGTTRVKLSVVSKEDMIARRCEFQLRAGADGMILTVIQSGVPVVDTSDAADILTHTATLRGDWSFAGDATIKALGFEYRKVGDAQWREAVSSSKEKGRFTVALTDLESTPYVDDSDVGGCTYEFRAFVKTAEYSTEYGQVMTFKTAGLPLLKSIAQVRALYSNSAVTLKPYEINAIVVTDTTYNNYTYIALVDALTPQEQMSGIFINQVSGSKVKLNKGDKVNISLVAGVLVRAPSGQMVVSLSATQITKLPTTQNVAPVKIAHTDINKYEAQLVEIDKTQLTPAFRTQQSKYPTWGSNSGIMNMEVEGSQTSYGIRVESAATSIYSVATQTGSGTLIGIASGYYATPTAPLSYMIYPRSVTDIALSEAPFESVLNFKFTNIRWDGAEMESDIANGNSKYNIFVDYSNAMGTEVISGVSLTASDGTTTTAVADFPSNTAFVVAGLPVTLPAGSGSLKISVRGTPTSIGTMTFTLNSILDGGSTPYNLTSMASTQVEATVKEGLKAPTDGNMTVTWSIPNGSVSTSMNSASSPLAVVSNNQSVKVSVTEISSSGYVLSTGGGWNSLYWGAGAPADNTVSNQMCTITYTVTINEGPVSLYDFTAGTRVTAVEKIMPVQYSINNATWVNSASSLPEGASNGAATSGVVKLYAESALQNLATGTVVRVKIIPVNKTTGVGRWAFGALQPKLTGKVGE